MTSTKSRRRKTGLIRAGSLAKVNWKPEKPEPNGKLLPSFKDWDNAGATARMAHALLLRTRDQLTDMHQKVDHKAIHEMMVQFSNTSEILKATITMIETAACRVITSACTHHVAGGKFVIDGESRA
jgi:hypothetical protein